MKLNKNAETTVLIVGLGLLGGSYARALKKKGYTVLALEKRQWALDFALENGIIDEGDTAIREDFIRKADLTVFALYPHVFVEWIKEHQNLLKMHPIHLMLLS